MFFTGIELKDKLYLYDSAWQGIFEYNLLNKKMKLIKLFDTCADKILFSRCIKNDTIVAFLPDGHRKLFLINTVECKQVEIDLRTSINSGYNGCLYNKCIILVPKYISNNSPILSVEIATGMVKTIDLDIESIVQRIAVNGEWLIFYDQRNDVVQKINLETLEHVQVQTDVHNGFAIFETDIGIFITARNSSNIYKVDENYKVKRKYVNGKNDGRTGYGSVVSTINGIYAIPNYGANLLKYSSSDSFIEISNLPKDFKYLDESKSKLPLYCEINNNLLFLNFNSNKLLLLETAQDKLSTLDIKIPQRIISELLIRSSGMKYIRESKNANLSDYVKAII